MERDVAVHEPCTGVIRFERQHEIAAGWKGGGVATRRIVELESGKITGPCCVFLGVEDEEVVAVEVDWMGKGGWNAFAFLDDPVLELWLGLAWNLAVPVEGKCSTL
jgi:hypothetical protein